MSCAICDLVLYLLSENLTISWIYCGTIPFQYLKTVFAIQYSTLSITGSQFIFVKCDGSMWNVGGKLKQNQIHLLWAFWSLSLNFFLKKEKTIRNIHNQTVAELAHYIKVFYTQELSTCFGNTGILVWHLFSLGVKLATKVLYYIVLFNRMARKRYINFL